MSTSLVQLVHAMERFVHRVLDLSAYRGVNGGAQKPTEEVSEGTEADHKVEA
jgi:hypothetical protein